MSIESGSESTQTLALLRATLNADDVACGSKATSATAAPLTASATAYTGGAVLVNSSAVAAEVIWICTTGPATVAGDDCYPLFPGLPHPIARGDLNTISAIAASGTPRIAWMANTL